MLREVAAPAARETDRGPLEAIARYFSEPSLERVVAGLQSAASRDEFAAGTVAVMRSRSPTSLHIAFREITLGSTMSMADCMRMEFRILNRILEGHDFYEGIRAVIVDKGDTPRWEPATLEAVEAAGIDRYFAPLGERELAL